MSNLSLTSETVSPSAALNPAVGRAFYQELLRLLKQREKNGDLRMAVQVLINNIIDETTKRERLPLSTYFARLAYAAHVYRLPKGLLYYLHRLRHVAHGNGPDLDDREQEDLAVKVCAELILGIWRFPPHEELVEYLPLEWPFPMREQAVAQFRVFVRVLVTDMDASVEQLIAYDAERPELAIRVQYNIPERNSAFNTGIQLLGKILELPVTMHLLDVEVGTDGIYRPRAFVLEPDFLIDVSGVAECYHGKITHPWGYLLHKFLPYETTLPKLLGNIANFFLDQLLTNPEETFQSLFARLFVLYPLEFCLLQDAEVRELMNKAQLHYTTIRQMLHSDFEAEGIILQDCYLEPSFYSMRYGLQGRLDLLYHPEGSGKRNAIVELKSGKPFMANIHGISPNHYIQTVLYDLMIHGAFGDNTNVGSYILYSGEEQRPLRFAPAVKAQQYEALQMRNQLLTLEYLLAQLGLGDDPLYQQGERLLGRLHPERFPEIKGFAQTDLQRFAQVFQGLNTVERAYFAAFCGCVAREQLLAKTGVQGNDQINGLASLWLDDPQEKDRNYQLLRNLELLENTCKSAEPLLCFKRTANTNALANFRVGDIVVLFPDSPDGRAMLHHQVFKCTVVQIDRERVTVRLRSSQNNSSMFEAFKHWAIEHDLLDSSFLSYYRGLYQWAGSPAPARRLILGQKAPSQKEVESHFWPAYVTQEQAAILDKMLAAPEYFLLWGPPGTGKTSVMLKELVRHLMDDSKENILLCAYTNRAVDEICEVLETISPDIRSKYFRIGSRYGTDERFEGQLLQQALSGVNSRKELKSWIAEKRIVVATVASLANQQLLFQLKKFQRIVIDEASQILEPVLAGLLPQFPKWILIGDHRQLPAVVTQDAALTQVKDSELRGAGITDLAQSLFERLYLQAQANNWHWCYDQLKMQGRMHRDIMAFPAQHFYNGNLIPLNNERQHRPLNLAMPEQANILEQRLAKERVIFLPTPVDDRSETRKTNKHEAQLIADLLKAIARVHASQPETPAWNIGIITPYRAQIAQLNDTLQKDNISTQALTIDTVERYQGGARDIIIISLCTNEVRQMVALSSKSVEGVDRKLNVAMTRAREQLILLGNPEILRSDEVYAALLDGLK